MKQQSLITTLAVLLAVSLSAIVALLISTDVLGARQTAAAVPASIEVQAPAPTAVPADAVDVAPTAIPVGDTATHSAARESAPTVAPTTDLEPAPTTGTDTEPTPDASTPDVEPEPTPTTPADDEAGDDNPTTGEPPCDGEVIDGNCVDISILCLLGYERVGDECVFVGCPLGHALQDGYCQPFDLVLPCANGFVRLDDGTCILHAVFIDPAILQPLLCGEGFAWVDGECVTVCPRDHYWTNGFCLPDFNFEFDIVDLSDIDLRAAIGN